MTDRELLELAAKAAGIEWIYEECDIFYLANPLRPWNPIEDDGDALRLAVKLHLFDAGRFKHFRLLEIRSDPSISDYEATRRAIVRAAAEIGKAIE